MKEFKNSLHVKNKKNFEQEYFNAVMSYLRKDIHEHIIKSDENEYFELDKFVKKYYKINIENIIKVVSDLIIPELTHLGWNCKKSYGGTALFIYSTEKPPPSCWDSDLN